jgi:hypothetical protein
VRIRQVVLMAVVGVSVGCAPPPNDTRLVLLDEAARRSGAAVVLREWEGSPAFPVRLLPEESPTLLMGVEASPLQVPAGTLAYVRGPLGEVELMDLEVEVNRDALRVMASESAAESLGELLDASVEQVGTREFELTAPDLIEQAAFIDPPRSVRDVLPVRKDGRRVAMARGPGSGPGMEGLPFIEGAGGAEGLQLTGLYTSEDTLLLLDAEGGFSLFRGCMLASKGIAERSADGSILELSPEHGRRMELTVTPEGVLFNEISQLLQRVEEGVKP